MTRGDETEGGEEGKGKGGGRGEDILAGGRAGAGAGGPIKGSTRKRAQLWSNTGKSN